MKYILSVVSALLIGIFSFAIVKFETNKKSENMTKILVVVDVQNDFVDGILGSKEAQARIPNIVNKINHFDGDYIFVTRDTHTGNYLETREGKNLPYTHCVKGTDGWNINPEVASVLHNVEMSEEKSAVVYYIDKPTFGSLDLINKLKWIVGKENFEIEFIGFCTDICVVSNAMLVKANYYETADITIDASCCAGVTPESHKAALATMTMCQMKIINDGEDK